MNEQFQTVILKHDTPDGQHHFDWLFAQDEPPTLKLKTWRVNTRPDQTEPGFTLQTEKIFDHRTTYLTYEGPISDNRGHVKRVAQGHYEIISTGKDTIKVKVHWETDHTQQWVLKANSITQILNV